MSHRARARRFAPFLTATALLLPAALAAQDADDREWLERCMEEDWGDRERFCEVVVESVDAPASTISIDGGPNGGARFIGWDEDRMEVHARIQAHADTRAEAREKVRQVRLEVTPEGASWSGTDEAVVVYRVFLPRRRNLEATAHNGPLGVTGVSGRIRLSTVNGPIRLEDVGGDVEADARNGPLQVVLTGSTWAGEGLDAETRNGPVQVSIPDGYSAVLETGTVNGPFTAEVPLVLEPGEVGHRIRAELGGGGPTVRVVTTNGPVSIRSR